jgi:hypothetical protein
MRLRQTLVVSVALAVACISTAWANPIPGPPTPQPLLSLEELLSSLEGDGDVGLAEAAAQAARLGPEYTWLLEDLVKRHDLEMVIGDLFAGLAYNGDSGSLAVLRTVVADTSRSDFVRTLAAESLADARDAEAIPLLEELAATAHGEAMANSMRRVILRMESPGHYRPLFVQADGLVRFGFLLDDIEAIEYTEQLEDVRCSFEPSDFRNVCDLLQAGSAATIGTTGVPGRLVFRLKDGREQSLYTDGRYFLGAEGGVVQSYSLGRYIWGRLGREYGMDEPQD